MPPPLPNDCTPETPVSFSVFLTADQVNVPSVQALATAGALLLAAAAALPSPSPLQPVSPATSATPASPAAQVRRVVLSMSRPLVSPEDGRPAPAPRSLMIIVLAPGVTRQEI